MTKGGSGDQPEEIKMKVRNSAEDAQQDGAQEAPAAGQAKGPAGGAGGKFPNFVAYLLLGLFVLLTIIFVVGMLKFKQISDEIKDFRDNLTVQLAAMKRDLGEDIRRGHAQLLREQGELGSKIGVFSRDVRNAHQELNSGQSQIINDIVRLADQTHRSHASFASQLAEMKENCQPEFKCPDQWTLFHQKCYHFSSTLEDWWTSQRFCLSKMSNLVVIDSSEEQAFLTQEIKLTRHWIGLNETHNPNEWVWVDGTNYLSTPRFWAPGEPNGVRSYNACAGMKNDGKWSISYCTQKFNFICERPVFCHFK